MKAFRLILVIVLSALAGIGIGFAFRKRALAATKPIARYSVARPAPVNLSRSSGETNGQTSPLRLDVLEKNLSFSAGVTQWLYWMEAIEKATTNDMPRLARLSRQNPGALRMVTLRWIELNPTHFFDTLLRAGDDETLSFKTLGHLLLDDWIKRDPAGLIAATDQGPPFGARANWRSQIAAQVIDKDPELGIRLMERWWDDRFTPDMKGVARWAAADPRHAAEFTLAHHAGHVSQAAAETIGREWGMIDPAAALEFALPSSGDLPELLAKSAFKAWGERDLSSAANWLAHADGSTRNRFATPFAEAWAAKDPASALIWAEANLNGTLLTTTSAQILKTAAEKDVASAAGLVRAMQPSAARSAAAVSVAGKWLPGLNDENAPKPEALAWIATLDSESIRSIAEKNVWTWGQSAPRSMADFLAEHPVSNIEPRVYALIAGNLARSDPRGAMDWVATAPENARASAGGEAFRRWHAAQPEAALEWWNSSSSTHPLRKSYLETALRDLIWEERATQQFAALAALDPAIARAVVEKHIGVPPERRATLLKTIASDAR